MTENRIVNFWVPIELLTQFDDAWKGQYGDRTEALLDLMRDFVKQKKKEASF